MSSKSQSAEDSQPPQQRYGACAVARSDSKGAESRAAEELRQQLQAMSQVVATQRTKAWYQASWVPVTTASLLVSVLGLAVIHQLTQPVRGSSSLKICEELLTLLDAPPEPSQPNQLVHSPAVLASWQTEPESAQRAALGEGQLQEHARKGRKFFADQGAPSYFCLTQLSAEDWRLERCEVHQLGSELISVRYFERAEEESPAAQTTRVFTVKRDALCKQGLSRLQQFDQQRPNASLVESPCSVSIILVD